MWGLCRYCTSLPPPCTPHPHPPPPTRHPQPHLPSFSVPCFLEVASSSSTFDASFSTSSASSFSFPFSERPRFPPSRLPFSSFHYFYFLQHHSLKHFLNHHPFLFLLTFPIYLKRLSLYFVLFFSCLNHSSLYHLQLPSFHDSLFSPLLSSTHFLPVFFPNFQVPYLSVLVSCISPEFSKVPTF